MTHLLARLDATPITRVEIGHGLGLEAELAGITPGNIDHHRWCEIARATLIRTSWGMFAQPGFTRPATIAELAKRGMSFVRIGVEPDLVPPNLAYIKEAAQVCGEVYVNLMKTSATPVEKLPELLAEIGPEVAGVYVVDSYGSMLPADVRRYVTVVGEHFPVVGFHGHNNLGMANINTLAAMDAGASVLDGTLNGIGRGSGNAAIESLAGIIRNLDSDRFDYQELGRLAEYCRLNMDVIGEDRTMQLLGGVIGIHSGFFPLVEELAALHRTEPALLMETAVEIADQSPRTADFHAAATRISAGVAPVHV
ncbi:MAG TPA: hypothetical protein VGD67_21205 [Pseudonocardiaceae bacterium]